MKKIILLFLIISLVILSGCTIRKNCRELNGYLCSSEGECALEWFYSSDSYCCPIECKTCPGDINCDDNDKCTKDLCVVKDGKPVCNHAQMKPCANNGICEPSEFNTNVPLKPKCDNEEQAVALPEEEVARPEEEEYGEEEEQIKNNDCSFTCDDGNPNTADWYNIKTQKCEHKACLVKVNEETYEIDGVLVTIKVYNIEGKGIGEYISVKNNRGSDVLIGPGCNYPISKYYNGACQAWSIRPYEDYTPFTYSFVKPKDEVKGWIWGLTPDFFDQYDTTKVKLTIQIDGQEISFIKDLTAILNKN